MKKKRLTWVRGINHTETKEMRNGTTIGDDDFGGNNGGNRWLWW